MSSRLDACVPSQIRQLNLQAYHTSNQRTKQKQEVTMTVEEQVIKSEDGTSIHVTHYKCEDPKAQILIAHGYLEHSKRYKEFAEYLNSQSIAATVFDLRGHGASEGERAYIDNWNRYVEDLEAVRSTLLPSGQLPTFVLGHSTGGLILIDYILRKDVKNDAADKNTKVILISPYTAPSKKLNPLKKVAAKLFGNVLPKLTIPAGLTSEELTYCPQKVKEHKEDPEILSRATTGWAIECMRAQERVQKAVDTTSVKNPVLFIYGDEDPVACPITNEEISQKLESRDKTVWKRQGEKHEVLNEVKRKELFQDISKWILERSLSSEDRAASQEN
eukprot:scaffold738_cov124-Cylindrotheca_fusiformis.AAC.16